jgi:hypothetical protein
MEDRRVAVERSLGIEDLESWFASQGHRLEFEPTTGSGRWQAVVLPGRRPMGAAAFLSAAGDTQLDAALSARRAFLQSQTVD